MVGRRWRTTGIDKKNRQAAINVRLSHFPIGIRVPDSHRAALEHAAAMRGQSVAGFVEWLVGPTEGEISLGRFVVYMTASALSDATLGFALLLSYVDASRRGSDDSKSPTSWGPRTRTPDRSLYTGLH